MPLSIHELKSWVGTPTIFVLDCSAAGVLLPHFIQPLSTDENEKYRTDPPTPPSDAGSMPGTAAAGGGGGGATAAAGNSGEGVFYFCLSNPRLQAPTGCPTPSSRVAPTSESFHSVQHRVLSVYRATTPRVVSGSVDCRTSAQIIFFT